MVVHATHDCAVRRWRVHGYDEATVRRSAEATGPHPAGAQGRRGHTARACRGNGDDTTLEGCGKGYGTSPTAEAMGTMWHP
ncbi:hypothetical protein GUJ93_ZPchr0011g27971 [Zizania palustris]|uniref:Uncharacterized protein n=1 Tax=Zizania palustris TaxID=103762 RepID=A0A8J5WHU6_ZIZPA|nr:hypothetical protein GUJ93_ZPchr0011g27971 [Zizania palustris]